MLTQSEEGGQEEGKREGGEESVEEGQVVVRGPGRRGRFSLYT